MPEPVPSPSPTPTPTPVPDAGIPNPQLNNPTPAPAPDFTSTIPVEYKDKEYLKDIKDMPGLLKKLDNAVATLGKRPAGIPHDNATDAEWQAFHKAMGVPDKAEEYEFNPPPELPVNDDFQKGMKEVLQKAGISKRQAKTLEAGYNGLVQEIMKKLGEGEVKNNENFDTLSKEVFGEEKDKALEVSNAFIAKYTPEKFKDHVSKLPNETLLVLASVIKGIQKDFISEDRIPKGGAPPGGPMGEDSRREEGRKLMASDAYTNFQHPDHDATVRRVTELYSNIK